MRIHWRPDGDGGWSRHWLPKREGTHAVGRTGGNPRPAQDYVIYEKMASSAVTMSGRGHGAFCN